MLVKSQNIIRVNYLTNINLIPGLVKNKVKSNS